MPRQQLAALRSILRDTDSRLLAAFDHLARHPGSFPDTCPPRDPRLPTPPLADLRHALCLAPPPPAPAPQAPAPAPPDLAQALLDRQSLAAQIADAKCLVFPHDSRSALELGDRSLMQTLIHDIAAELQSIAWIRDNAPRLAPNLPPDLAIALWREHIIPWSRDSELAHLMAP